MKENHFVPLRNYTTLKRVQEKVTAKVSFVPLRNYTTLKLCGFISGDGFGFCTSTKLHYSQTGLLYPP